MMRRVKEILGPGPYAMLLSGFFFSGMSALIKGISNQIPIFEMIFFRAAVSAIIILCVMLGRGISFRGSNQKILIVRALAGFTAMCCNFYALSKINLGDASVLNQSAPLFVLIFSWIFLQEKVHRLLLILTVISFLGICIVLHPSGNLFNLGGLAGLGSAFFAAGAYVSIRHLHRTDSFWTMAFYFMAAAALLSLPPMVATWKTPNPTELLLLIGTGIFGTLGQLLMTFAYKYEEASWVAPFAYAGVLFSFLWGIFFFGEIPDWASLIGAIITIGAGMAILTLKKLKA